MYAIAVELTGEKTVNMDVPVMERAVPRRIQRDDLFGCRVIDPIEQ